MPHSLDRNKIRNLLSGCNLQTLFIEELGWDYGGKDAKIRVGDNVYTLEAIAQKRGMVAYQYIADPKKPFPNHPTRQKIERRIAKIVREHLIVYVSSNDNTLYWQWVKREPGQSERIRQHIYRQGDSSEALTQKLEHIVFTLDEEEEISIVDVSSRVRAAFDVEKVTKKFYDRFKKEHDSFLRFIEGIENLADREWYASLMLNRMMFIYFIQKRGFLDSDSNYLQNRLIECKNKHGLNRFQTFYRLFLLRLFHEGLGQPEADRDANLIELLGRVPYLNGGLFDVHDLEQNNTEIHIPDEAFEKIFDFFDVYQWHLDDRPLRNDNEINPDVLGYIFEKYINQKQMGAYYTKEDITGYISRNTVLPFLFDRAKKECAIAFESNGGVWRLLAEDPDRYIYESVRHGITYDIHTKQDLQGKKRELPNDIDAGLNDVSKRSDWNRPAPEDYALPTETWREHVARRQRYEEVASKLRNGEITSINDLITYNLDIEKFALDVISNSEGAELVRAFWKAASKVSILDPTCGSGAFLFAALNILESIYTACLEAMQGFLDDLDRSERKHHPEKLSDFRKVLSNISNHPSERYFTLKSIIVNNLYGVDIMEEAVEICKLRLFLKLVSQLETYDQIEPLPDIDFNVRAGNTLVGFVSMTEIQKTFTITQDGQHRVLYPEDQSKLARIEEDAEIADRAFRQFNKMQIDAEMDANAFTEAKLTLGNRLDNLRAELDGYLASEYGYKTDDTVIYEKWRSTHQPFHWFIEFYGIMKNGGFDVIIGNPPYVEYKELKIGYKIKNLSTKFCGNLYAFVMERCKQISNSRSFLSMIVPLSGHSTKRMLPLMNIFYKNFRSCHLFNISADAHPSILFPGVKFRLSIFIVSNLENKMFTTGYLRWYAEERNHLFNLLHYIDIKNITYDTAIPKISNSLHLSILIKLLKSNQKLTNILVRRPIFNNNVFYHAAPVNWIRAHTQIPYFYNQRDGIKKSNELKKLYPIEEKFSRIVQAILCSTTFFIYWLSLSDAYHLNKSELHTFPISINDELISLSEILEHDMQVNSKKRVYNYKTTGRVEYDEFYMKRSKKIIDDIDRVLAKYYDFTDEELDFIINYDIKYRMGRNNLSNKKFDTI